MKTRNLQVCVTICFLLGAIVPRSADAQALDPNRSTGNPNSVYDMTNIDRVDIGSGNLRVAIPVLHLPGRGLDTDYVFTYNSKIYQTVEYDDPSSGTIFYTAQPDSAAWIGGIPRMGSVSDLNEICTAWAVTTCMQSEDYLTYRLNDGTRVSMADDVGPENDTNPPNYVGAGFWSIDGSYMRILGVPGLTPYYLYENSAITAVIFKDGTRFNPHTQTLTDTNGNFIQQTDASHIVDTLGRTITLGAGTVSYLDSSGTTRTITLGTGGQSAWYPLSWVGDNSQCQEGGFCYATTNSQNTLPSLTLPNGFTYHFEYLPNPDDPTGSTGELTKIILPTGGYIKYTYDSESPAQAQYRRVVSRTVSSDGTPATEQTWTYSLPTYLSNVPGLGQGGWEQFTETMPNGSKIVSTFDRVTKMLRSEVAEDSAGNPLRSTLSTVGCDNTTFFDPLAQVNGGVGVCSNLRVLTQTTTLGDTNQQSLVSLAYDHYGNVTQKNEYDWGNGTHGSLLRTTTIGYLQNSNTGYAASNVNILNRVTSNQVCGAGSSLCSQTTIAYDGVSPQTTSNVVSHDYQNFSSAYNLRGNPTQTQRYLNTSASNLTTTSVFNDVGNLIQTTNPNGNSNFYGYSDNFYNFTPPHPTSAYVTQVTRPTTNGVAHLSRSQYYFGSGAKAANCGENFAAGSACSFGLAAPQSDYSSQTYDLWNRPLTTFHGDGGQSTNCYSEVVGSGCYLSSGPLQIVTTTAINSSQNLVSTAVLDALGRPNQTQLNSNPGGVVYTDTTYDAMGRVATVNNPHLSTSGATDGITTTGYDALGRVTVVTAQDGGQTITSYSGNSTTVTDPAGKQRRSFTDALGRLTEVDEPISNSLTSPAVTRYSYDPLDNLTCVVQKGTDTTAFTTCAAAPAAWRPRTFVYDSLSRMTSVTNPESGAISYTYDANGNLRTQTSPAPNQTGGATITLSNCYDALDRLTSKAYSAQSCPMASPVITYSYDQTTSNGLSITNGIDRRTSMTDSAGSEAWSFDTMGRIRADRRTTNGVTKDTVFDPYTYLGGMTKITYPSGRAINYTYNSANQLLTAVDTANSINYATNASYGPTGAVSGIQNGTNIVSTLYYNSRLQPCRISVRTSSSAPTSCSDMTNAGNILDYTYGFNLGAGDNGNIASIANNRDATRSQNFTYDALNRISTAATQVATGSHAWGTQYTLDAWGNFLSSSTTQGAAPQGTIGTTQLNQIPGYCYDAAGNLLDQQTCPSGFHTYIYDAENRMTSAAGVTYTYDGDGNRVQKSTGTLYWYGSTSSPLDETDAAGNTNNSNLNEYIFFDGNRIARRDFAGNVFYFFTDNLGTSREVLQAGQTNPCYDADFYPFGGEIIYTNTCPQNYKFTGKERDGESGLDDFTARFYASTLGRFLSPDEPLVGQSAGDPQSWNLYTYVRNNPLNAIDPDGHDCIYPQSASTDQGTATIHVGAEKCAAGDGGIYVQGTITYVNYNEKTKELSVAVSDGGTIRSVNLGQVHLGGGGGGFEPGALFGAATQGVHMAKPGVDVASAILVAFGTIVAPELMIGTQCLSEGCSKGDVAMALLPELKFLREGAIVLKIGKGVEILEKVGGMAEATKDFEALDGPIKVYNTPKGILKVKELSGGTRAILRGFSSDGRATLEIQEATGAVTKFRY